MKTRRLLRSCGVLMLVGFAAAGGASAQEGDGGEEASATDRAVQELSAAYERLAGLLGDSSDVAVGGVRSDIENVGDWEYRIVELDEESPEALEIALNEFGNERWEVFWVDNTDGNPRFYMKRSSISYLSRLPVSELIKLLTGGMQ